MFSLRSTIRAPAFCSFQECLTILAHLPLQPRPHRHLEGRAVEHGRQGSHRRTDLRAADGGNVWVVVAEVRAARDSRLDS
jgi:hypothetical protein